MDTDPTIDNGLLTQYVIPDKVYLQSLNILFESFESKSLAIESGKSMNENLED